MLSNLNHKTLTADKLILEEKKNLQTEKKTIINYAKKRTCTATYVMEHSWTLLYGYKVWNL